MRLRETAPWLAAFAIAIACFVAWRWLSAAMFSRNPQYELRRVEISPGYAKSEREIRDITGLREGVNLFSFRASEVRERLLRTTPNIADVEISKSARRRWRSTRAGSSSRSCRATPSATARCRASRTGPSPTARRPGARSPTRPGRRRASRPASRARSAWPCSATAPNGRSASPTST